jgi:SAM-dependent methyltransferase
MTTPTELNPQAEQMADESMVRTLAAQAQAIWPEERALFDRYRLPEAARILDAGCGTGEITWRLAEHFPSADLLGVDIVAAHLVRARSRGTPRVRYEERSVYDLGLPDGTFDLTVCRHVLHAIPHAERVIAELVRVTRPGGRLHLLVEDYGMIQFAPRALDHDAFWQVGPRRFGEATGTDLYLGRKAPKLLAAAGLEDITVDYVVVDPLRAPRETVAAIFTAWRDGYTDVIAQHTSMSRELVTQHFDDMIAELLAPDGYAVWFAPVLGARRPLV